MTVSDEVRQALDQQVYANLLAHPAFTLHLRDRDLQAHGRAVTDPQERARVFGEIVPSLDWAGSLADWIAGSPLVEIEFAGQDARRLRT